MSLVLKAIQQWASSQPVWQQEAAVRLFEAGELTVSDDADLFALLTSAHGIEDPLQRKARVFSADLVIPDQAAGKIIRLQSIRNLRNINALAEGKTLSFAAEGLTVIYGDNGSGKSGYARVFKKACRARDRDDPVLPNANRPTSESGPAQAEFDMLVDGVTVPAIWKHGEASPDVLASLAIFDARCARAYLDEQDDYAYAPYGMDILRELGAACGRLKILLDQEQKKTTPNTSAFSHLKGQPTGVGKFLDQLSAATKIADLDALATLTPEEISESERLQKALNETNPKEKAQQLRLRSGRLIELGKRCTRAMAVVDDGVVDHLQQLVKKSATAKAAVNIATENFKSGSDYLPGTGGEEWKALFEAARKFATEAYPGQTFPALGADAPCPLCQQPLGTAVERLLAFDTYIQTDAEKQWRSSQSAAKAAIDVMSKANLDIGFDTALHAELRALDSSLADQLSQIESRLDQRRIDARDACYGKATWADLPTQPENPVSGLHALAQAMQGEAEALEKLVDEVTAAAMRTRSRDLAARKSLGQVRGAVAAAIESHQYAKKLQACTADIRSRPITDKSTELSDQIISKALEAALNTEFAELSVQELQVALKAVGVKGSPVYKLALMKPGQQRPAAVLSDGEQRAIAIASFFADINLSGTTAGMVFDDPVSSLDHLRRWHVVARMVKEAAKRQVIILTHDLYFLVLLQQEAKQAQVPCLVQSLHRTADGYGVPESTIPFKGALTTKRIGMLKNARDDAARLLKQGSHEASARMVRSIYYDLRNTWERAVEEVLLNGVVNRFAEAVHTSQLSDVEVSDDDYRTVVAAMTRCSKFAHDGAPIANVPTPSPDELGKDIEILDNWRKDVDDRKKVVQKKRKL